MDDLNNLTGDIDFSNFSIKDVSTVLYKIADICRMIIDALKSFIKPILKMGFDAMEDKVNGANE